MRNLGTFHNKRCLNGVKILKRLWKIILERDEIYLDKYKAVFLDRHPKNQQAGLSALMSRGPARTV